MKGQHEVSWSWGIGVKMRGARCERGAAGSTAGCCRRETQEHGTYKDDGNFGSRHGDGSATILTESLGGGAYEVVKMESRG